jgi:predicted ATPase
MIIQRIEVLNYKCLHYTFQNLGSFQILIGPNASGKSTFLDVLVFVRDLLNEGLWKTIAERARSLRELTWRKEGSRFEIAIEMRIPQSLRERKLLRDYSTACYEIAIGTDKDGVSNILAENLWLMREFARSGHTPDDRDRQVFPQEPKVPKTIVREPQKRIPSGYRKVMSRHGGRRMYMCSETTRWTWALPIDAEKAGITFIPEDGKRFPVSTWVRKMLKEGIQFLMLDSQKMRNPCPPDAPRTFLPDGSNLPLLVETLRQNKKQFRMWVDHLKTVLPQIDDISVEEQQQDRHKYLVVHTSDGKSLPSWLLSDGTLRLFALTLLAYLPGDKGIYIIEEPENGIHPRALEAVYQSLSSIYEGQVFCATHSPVLLSLSKPQELLCFALTPEGATDIVRGDEHPMLMEWKSSVPLGDLLASGVLG